MVNNIRKDNNATKSININVYLIHFFNLISKYLLSNYVISSRNNCFKYVKRTLKLYQLFIYWR